MRRLPLSSILACLVLAWSGQADAASAKVKKRKARRAPTATGILLPPTPQAEVRRPPLRSSRKPARKAPVAPPSAPVTPLATPVTAPEPPAPPPVVAAGGGPAARRACSSLKSGSPKPRNGRRVGSPGGSDRSVASAVTEGRTVTAWVRASHGTAR
jgi:hypothetical protein